MGRTVSETQAYIESLEEQLIHSRNLNRLQEDEIEAYKRNFLGALQTIEDLQRRLEKGDPE